MSRYPVSLSTLCFRSHSLDYQRLELSLEFNSLIFFVQILVLNFHIITKNKKAKTYQVGDDDHTACPRSSARKKSFSKLNGKWDAELFSTKVEIPTDVLVDL